MRARPKPQTGGCGLWAVFWRACVVAPIIVPLGFATLMMVLLFDCLPFCAVVFGFAGDYGWAALMVLVWILWRRWGGPVRRWFYEGFEYGSL